MMKWIGVAIVACVVGLAAPASAQTATPAKPQPGVQQHTGKSTDFSAQRYHHRRYYRHYGYRPYYRPYYGPSYPGYYARPYYYRPYPYYSPAPFTFGFGFGPYW